MKRDLTGLLKRGVGQGGHRPNHPIEKIMLSSAGFTRQPTDVQVDAMAATIADALKPLLGIAMSGNVHAIRRAAELAGNLCAEMTMLACMHQDAANQVARERTTWPLNVPGDPHERRRTLRLLNGPRRLPLGETNPPPTPQTKPSGFSAPASTAVLMAIKAIEIERAFRVPSELFPVLQPEWSVAAAQLPDLDATASTADRWFDVIWLYVCQRHRGTPERSALRKLAESDARPDSADAIRQAIKHALREAFLRMLRQRGKRKRGA
jgi:hypothetical protein